MPDPSLSNPTATVAEVKVLDRTTPSPTFTIAIMVVAPSGKVEPSPERVMDVELLTVTVKPDNISPSASATIQLAVWVNDSPEADTETVTELLLAVRLNSLITNRSTSSITLERTRGIGNSKL